jgi:hypothetical protein
VEIGGKAWKDGCSVRWEAATWVAMEGAQVGVRSPLMSGGGGRDRAGWVQREMRSADLGLEWVEAVRVGIKRGGINRNRGERVAARGTYLSS